MEKRLFEKRVKALEGLLSKEKEKRENVDRFYNIRQQQPFATKKIHTYDFSKQENLILVPISDVHLGHRECNKDLFKAYIQYILETDGAYTILNGDLAETATKVSVGKGMFEEEFSFPEQMKYLEEHLRPLAVAGKILGVGPGNHEERIANMIGLNPMEILAERLSVPYFGYQGFFKLKVGRVDYSLVFHHGVGGGGTTGSRSNSAEKMNKVVGNADIYVSGHTHARQFHHDLIYLVGEDEELVAHKRTYVVAGSFVEYFKNYSEMKALPPSITGAVRLHLNGQVKDVRVDL